MERKIGEQFKYKGVKLEVCVTKAPKSKPCGDCYFQFKENRCFEYMDITGKCYGKYRTDKREVFFKEVKK